MNQNLDNLPNTYQNLHDLKLNNRNNTTQLSAPHFKQY